MEKKQDDVRRVRGNAEDHLELPAEEADGVKLASEDEDDVPAARAEHIPDEGICHFPLFQPQPS